MKEEVAELSEETVPVQADGQWHEYSIPVGDHAKWRGQKITELRLDPGNRSPGGHVEIDWVRGEGR